MIELKHIVKSIDGLVDEFVSKAQMLTAPGLTPLGKPTVEHGDSIKDVLNDKYQQAIQNDATMILQKLSDEIWNRTEQSFGYFEIDTIANIKNGNVSIGFALSSNLGVNKENNQEFSKKLNAILPRKYNGKISATVKSLEGGSNYTGKFTLFQMSGNV